MLNRFLVKNYKSITSLDLELGRFNIFIGENGCGKTNILESMAFLASAEAEQLDPEELYGRGIRIAKPAITFSSFLGKRPQQDITLEYADDLMPDPTLVLKVTSEDVRDIYSKWSVRYGYGTDDKMLAITLRDFRSAIRDKKYLEKLMVQVDKMPPARVKDLQPLKDFCIYSLSTKALRGIYSESKRLPLGINGEGLDVLIATLPPKLRKRLVELAQLVSWVGDVVLDPNDELKLQGHKLGKSTSTLYFKDRFMRLRNNVFSAENANEGILHSLFYLTLFLSDRTPPLFAIDNIETALNPQLCRRLVKELATLAKETNKQALITTHNPAALDGLNLHDDEQRLFAVYRSDTGETQVKRIKLKKDVEVDGHKLKLSELWMRGHLGGLPTHF